MVMKTTTLMTGKLSGFQMVNIIWLLAFSPFAMKFFAPAKPEPPRIESQLMVGDNVSLNCKNNVNISISQTGVSEVIPAFFIAPSYPNFMHLISIIQGRDNNIITCADVGKDLMIIVTDTLTHERCMTSFHVEDKMPPTFICEDVEVPCGIGLDDQTLNEYAGFATDNCTDPVNLTLIDYVDSVYSCPSPYTYKSTRTYVATDASGNSSSCTFNIFFLRPLLDSIVFPNDTTIECTNFSKDTSVTGQPTFMGYPLTGVCYTWFYFDDRTTPMGCEGRFKIRRIWTVLDECNGTSRRDTQFIMSIDTTPPSITCPADITIGTDGHTCAAVYTFPAPTVSDGCTPKNQITIKYKVDGIIRSGPSVTLEPGAHIIQYTADDKCNNTSTCTYTVTVVDIMPPDLTCHDITVALNNQGEGKVCADSLLFDYSDNCPGELSIQIRKMQDDVFTDCVTYTCDEIGTNNMLVFEVCDEAGNCNTCMVTVDVQDKERPVIDCTNNRIAVHCDGVDAFDIHHHVPPISDNCGIADTLFQKIQDNVSCGTGEIIWRIIAVDNAGLRDSCDFHVIVDNPYPFDELIIDWPENISLMGCSPNVNDTSLTGFPHVSSPYCNPLWIGAIIDSTITDEGCLIVEKTWRVIDSCIYIGGDEGIMEHKQIINADGGLPPIFTFVPPDVTVDGDVSCDAYVQLDSAKAKACATPVIITNSYTDGGPDASGTYPEGTTIITFTATDTCGRVSTATTSVTVNTPGLVLECPDTTMTCDTYSPDFIPLPILIFSCGDTTLVRTYTENLNICGGGTVDVHYVVTDENGHVAICDFTIIVQNNGALTDNDIDWPETPLIFDQCDVNLDPDSLDSRPVITNVSSCAHYSISYEDVPSTPLDSLACYAIDRNWTVVDSCSLDNMEGGIHLFVQHFEFIDTIAPVFHGYTLGDTIYFFVDTLSCDNFVDLSGLTVTDCNLLTVINDSPAPDADHNSVDASGTYGIGTTTINYTATDSCGNTSIFQLFTFGRDTVAPKWKCPVKIPIVMNEDGIDTLHAYELEQDTALASDNCTLHENLRFTFDSLDIPNDSLIFICMGSINFLLFKNIPVFVFDESGNFKRCLVAIEYILPPSGDVDCSHTMLLMGTIYNEVGLPIDKVKIMLVGENRYSMNGLNGDYWIYDIPPGADLEVACDKEDNPLNGISTRDIIELHRHLLGTKSLKTPYQMLAADVNGDQKLSTKDILDLRSLIVGNTTELPCGFTWRFADANYRFADPTDPFHQPQVFNTRIQNVTGMVPKANFVGIKMGDLNSSAKVNAKQDETEIRDQLTLPLVVSSEQIQDDLIEVTFSAKELENYMGFQFELNFDASVLQFQHYVPGNLSDFNESNVGVKNATRGKIGISWDNMKLDNNSEIIHLYFKVLRKGNAALTLNESRINAEAYTLDNNVRKVVLEGADVLAGAKTQAQGILYQNIPNPFTHNTTIKILLNDNTQGIFTVYDITGKVIWQKSAEFEKGLNSIELKAEDLGRSGVYFYRFESSSFSETRKMIFTL